MIMTHTKKGAPRCCICLDGRRKITKWELVHAIGLTPILVPVCHVCAPVYERSLVWGTHPSGAYRWAYSYKFREAFVKAIMFGGDAK